MNAQSAMEYLMTYGWAILIIALVLGVLFQLGVFGAGAIAGDSCLSQSGFSCSGLTITSYGGGQINFGQELGIPITVTATGCSNSTRIPTTTFSITSVTLQSGATTPLTFQCNLRGTTLGSPFSGTLWIVYNTGTQIGAESEIAIVSTEVSSIGTPPFSYAYAGNSGSGTLSLSGTYSNVICAGANWEGDTPPNYFTPDISSQSNADPLAYTGQETTPYTASCSESYSSVNSYQSWAAFAYSNAPGITILSSTKTIGTPTTNLGYTITGGQAANDLLTVISVECGSVMCYTVNVPVGCSAEEQIGLSPILVYNGVAAQLGTSYLALCQSQAAGSYAVNVVSSEYGVNYADVSVIEYLV